MAAAEVRRQLRLALSLHVADEVDALVVVDVLAVLLAVLRIAARRVGDLEELHHQTGRLLRGDQVQAAALAPQSVVDRSARQIRQAIT